MFSREEAAKLRQQFWINFGKYMKPIPNAEGLPTNWINYKTGIKDLFFKMDTEQKYTSISIEIAHTDDGMRNLIFQQFQEFKTMFEDVMGEDWTWLEEATNGLGKKVARIEFVLDKVSVFNTNQWPEMFEFLKNRMIKLDEFWCDVKPIFQDFVR